MKYPVLTSFQKAVAGTVLITQKKEGRERGFLRALVVAHQVLVPAPHPTTTLPPTLPVASGKFP